jgi:LmbE family N-acetylglucosaminyl deacetylase
MKRLSVNLPVASALLLLLLVLLATVAAAPLPAPLAAHCRQAAAPAPAAGAAPAAPATPVAPATPASPAAEPPPYRPDPGGPTPRILLVTAHPDDDALFGGSVYKITHALGGKVDLVLVTNGEGGYKYSILAEPIYHLKLTDEAIGRQYLPGIRKRELMAGGAIVGIRNYFFLDQPDNEYTQSWAEAQKGWDLPLVTSRIATVLKQGNYDFVFVMLPTLTTHGGHQGAALLALQAVAAMPRDSRPIVLGGTGYRKSSPQRSTFTGRDDYPVAKIRADAPRFEFDRTQKFGFNNRLDYNIVVNWQIAEHKSQGTMQNNMNGLDVEQYLFFDFNRDEGIAKAQALFERLKATGP